MNLKQAKKLRKTARLSGKNWRALYKLAKQRFKANPIPLPPLKAFHAAKQREE